MKNTMLARIERRIRRSHALYYIYTLYNGNNTKILVNKDTDIVIEGFGGSGNTFLLRAFMLPQLLPYSVAHHAHTPSQIIRGANLKIPVILIVRNPKDAVRSPDIESSLCNVVVIEFGKAIKDFGVAIAEVNRVYNKNFNIFSPTAENIELIQSEQKTAKPGTERIVNVDTVTDILENESLANLVEKANILYSNITEKYCI